MPTNTIERSSREDPLDAPPSYGIKYPMPKGRLVLHTKYVDEVGGIIEMKAYQVPRTASAPHGYKYSLVYILNGERLVGYDNHEQQGDHRHRRGEIFPYTFTSIDRLVDDFLHDLVLIKRETHT